MDKNSKIKLLKVFDNICRNSQYVQHYKGCRIVSYNNPETESLLIQFHHSCNDFSFSHSFILDEIYTLIDLELFTFYYKLSLRIFREKLKNFIDNELSI